MVAIELDEGVRGALSARVLCMAGGNGDEDGDILGGSGTVTETNVSTKRD